MNSYLGRRGILATILMRHIPLAPFTVVNMAAGTTGLKTAHFLIGTAIGMLPGILVITLFTDQVLDAFQNPTGLNIALAAGAAGLLAIGILWLRKRLRRPERQ